jgi:hypothetical protein
MLKKNGASILEALIASFILAIVALAYGQLQVQNFTQILLNERLEKVSYAASDFATKMITNITNRETVEDKEDVELIYNELIFNVSNNQCNNEKSYIDDCLNLDLDNQLICTLSKTILIDMYQASCDTYLVAPQANFNLEYCDNSGLGSMCFWINMDGEDRTELQCRNNINNCVLMEIKI